MPPKKSAPAAAAENKVVQLKGDEAEAAILAYLQTQNRPYNATDISLNMKTVSKTITAKALTTLAEKNEIVTKTYGKQAIYWPKQANASPGEPEDLDQIKADSASLGQDIVALKDQIKSLTANKDKMAAIPPTFALPGLIAQVLEENEQMTARLSTADTAEDGASFSGAALVSKADLDAQSKQLSSALAVCRERRRSRPPDEPQRLATEPPTKTLDPTAFVELLDCMMGEASNADRDKFLEEVLGGVPVESAQVQMIEQKEKEKLCRPVKKPKLA